VAPDAAPDAAVATVTDTRNVYGARCRFFRAGNSRQGCPHGASEARAQRRVTRAKVRMAAMCTWSSLTRDTSRLTMSVRSLVDSLLSSSCQQQTPRAVCRVGGDSTTWPSVPRGVGDRPPRGPQTQRPLSRESGQCENVRARVGQGETRQCGCRNAAHAPTCLSFRICNPSHLEKSARAGGLCRSSARAPRTDRGETRARQGVRLTHRQHHAR